MNPKFYDPRYNSNTSFAVQVDTIYKELNRPILSEIPSITESIVTEDEHALKYLTAAMFASVLEDTITSIIILGKCNTALNLRKTLLNMNTLIKKKYDIKPCPKPEDPIRHPLDCDENKIEKMLADRELCLQILTNIYKEMSVSRTYHHLQRFLQEKETKEDNMLVKEVSEKRSQYSELKKKLRSQRHVHTMAKYDSKDLISRLTDLIGDTEQLSTMKHKYLSDWKQAQTEQHLAKIQDVQEVVLANIERNRYEFDREIRAHAEMERFNNALMAEQVEKIDEIMEMYDDGIEEMDLKIQVMMSQLAAMQKKKIEMENKFAKRQQEMDAWVQYREVRAEKQAQMNRYHKAAVIVQAWWRGLLVRQRLGPYKPGKKGRRGKKKKRLSEEIE